MLPPPLKLAQLMPAGLEVMVPVPDPEKDTLSANIVAGPKLTVTVVAAFMVTAQVLPVPEQPPPLQPVSTAFGAAVAVNVTTVNPAALGSLSIYPGNAFPLGTNNLNFAPGKNRANNAILYLATNGTGTIGVQNNSSGTLNFIVDAVGYFR